MNDRLDTSLFEFDPILFSQNISYFNSEVHSENSRIHNGFEMSPVEDVSTNDSEMSSHSLDTWLYNYQLSDGTPIISSDVDVTEFAHPQTVHYRDTESVSAGYLVPPAPVTASCHFEMPQAFVPAFEELGLISNSSFTDSTNQNQEEEDPSSSLCPVCGNEAGKHVHYGGRACTSCRAFFRRSVQNDSYKTFSCTAFGGCKIDSKSWRSCRFCRYQKCLKSGMKPTWVLNETERQVRHEKRTSGTSSRKKNLRQLQQQSSPSNSGLMSNNNFVPVLANPTDSSHSITWAFTTDELNQMLGLVYNWKSKMVHHVFKFYSANPYLFKELISALYYRTNVPYTASHEMEARWFNVIQTVLLQDSEIGTLALRDSTALIGANLRILQIFIQSVLLGNNRSLQSTGLGDILLRLLNLNDTEDEGSSPEMKVLNKIMRDLKVGGLPERTLSYEQVFASPWAASIDIEERHAQLTYQISPWPLENPTQGDNNVDRLQMYLLCHIMLFSTDQVQVNDVTQVSKLQDNYMTMLHRYLKFKYNQEANSRLAKGFMISSLAREAQEIRSHRLPV